jgi:dCTP deaminase
MIASGTAISMSERDIPELFPVGDGGQGDGAIDYRKTGILPSQWLKALIAEGMIVGIPEITPDQIQPASLDLRLGPRVYRVRASFLPGPNSTVLDKVKQLDGEPHIDLTAGPAVLEKNAVYVADLCEHVTLKGDYVGIANPKSSIGRVDVLTRLITDRATAFDRVEQGYKGKLYVEICPLSFSVVVKLGTRLNQLRIQRGTNSIASSEMERLYTGGQLVRSEGGLLPLRSNRFVPVSVDLLGTSARPIVGYKARKNTNKIDLDRIAHYDPREFWEKIEHTGGHLNLDEGDFYILATREDVGVPPDLAAEMMPYDSSSGEFRVHYAGFFDPGFGWSGKAEGSRAVLEVRSYGVSFTLDHGQIVGWLNYTPLATGKTDKRYGEGIKSNYQGQGVALAKFFKPWSF